MVANSTLSRANETRSFLIYQDLAQLLIQQAKLLYKDDKAFGVRFKNNLLAVNVTILVWSLSTLIGLLLKAQKRGESCIPKINLKTSIANLFFFNFDVHNVIALIFLHL